MPMFSEGSSESGELGVLLVDGSHLLVGSRSSHHRRHDQDCDCDGTDHKLTDDKDQALEREYFRNVVFKLGLADLSVRKKLNW